MIISLAILSTLFLAQLLAPKALARQGLFGFLIFAAAVLVIFGFAFYQSGQQYLLWKNDEMGKLLLPPYQGIDYFIFYSRTRFFNPYLLSLFFGLAFLWAAKILNKKYEERFFWPIEPYLLAAAVFLLGHPAWIFYLIAVLSIFLIINFSLSTFHFLLNKEMPRISLYYLWLPAAIFTIIISKWITVLPWWQILKF